MAFKAGRPWTQEDEEALVTFYTSGWKNVDIAERLSRSAAAVGDRITRLRNMGLLSQTKPDPAFVQPAPTFAEVIRYLPVEEACACHAEVVMAQGGFCALSEKRIGRNTWAVCLPLVWPKRGAN